MNVIAPIGHNNPPDPIDEINARFEAARLEAENWADGSAVENEAQMNAVDVLRKDARAWRLELEAGQKSATAPLYDAYKDEGARWKPTIDDAKRIEGCLVALVDGFKRKLAAEKAEAARKAEAEAWAKTRAAQEAVRQADASNLEDNREAAAKIAEAEAAQEAAKIAKADTVKGMRTVTRYRLIDPVLLARHLWANDREAQGAYHIDRATKLGLNLPGVFEKYQEKEAY